MDGHFDCVPHGAGAFADPHGPFEGAFPSHLRVKDVIWRKPWAKPTCPGLIRHKSNRIVQTESEVRHQRGHRFHHADVDRVRCLAAMAIHHTPNPFEIAQFRGRKDPKAVGPRFGWRDAIPILPNLCKELKTCPFSIPSPDRLIAAQCIGFSKLEFHGLWIGLVAEDLVFSGIRIGHPPVDDLEDGLVAAAVRVCHGPADVA